MLETNLKYNLTDKYQSNYDLARLRSLSVRKRR